MGTIYYINIRKTEVTGETYSTIAINMPSGTLIGGSGSSGTSSSGDTVIVSSSSSPNIDDDWLYIRAPESLVGQLQILYDESGAFRDLLIVGKSIFHITEFKPKHVFGNRNTYSFIPSTTYELYHVDSIVYSKCGRPHYCSLLLCGNIGFYAEVCRTYCKRSPIGPRAIIGAWIHRFELDTSGQSVGFFDTCQDIETINMTVTHSIFVPDNVFLIAEAWPTWGYYPTSPYYPQVDLVDFDDSVVLVQLPTRDVGGTPHHVGIVKYSKNDLSLIDQATFALPSNTVRPIYEWHGSNAVFAKYYEESDLIYIRVFYTYDDYYNGIFTAMDELYVRASDLQLLESYSGWNGYNEVFCMNEGYDGCSSTEEFELNGKKAFITLVPVIYWSSQEPPDEQFV